MVVSTFGNVAVQCCLFLLEGRRASLTSSVENGHWRKGPYDIEWTDGRESLLVLLTVVMVGRPLLSVVKGGRPG